jgi:glycogen debranching enzyme
MNEPTRISLAEGDFEDRYQILAMPSLTLAGTRVLKQGDTFAVFDRYGDIRSSGIRRADGLYHEGARFLSALRLRVEQQPLLLLSSTVRENNVVLAVDLMNPDLHQPQHPAIPHGTLHVFRTKFLWQAAYYEQFQVTNFGMSPIAVVLELEFAADFADVFEVRGTHRDRHGTLHPPEHTDSEVVLAYTGLDGESRRSRLHFTPAPDECEHDRVLFRIELDAKQTRDIHLEVACETTSAAGVAAPRKPLDFETAHADASRAVRRHEHRDTRIYTSNDQFNAWITRSVADLQMLLTDNGRGPYPYAGVPWFSTPFGRDGILTALSALWINPEIARGVLGCLAATQAEGMDEDADAEPGKIVHELRDGEMARLREVPFGRYYGSIDSTPLFVMLAAAYHDATGDLDFSQRLWPHVERALQWIDLHGDRDGDGFVEYGRRCPDGLLQQGWKDSVDSVFHADGALAEGPIALCEVQGYVYAAKLGAARIAAALGHGERSGRLTDQAEALRARFDAAFWCEDLSTYALALDGHKRPCRVRTSNAGQCLYTGIVLPERAALLADQLLAPEMFSGWGVRTLATTELRHNPMGYHNGTVWPHDNALIAAGLANYGHKDHAIRILAALFNASLFLELNRLPELFCGFARRPGEGPTLYPVACSPQAWASASPFLILRAVLGLSLDGSQRRVRFDYPAMPRFLNEIHIYNLRAGTSAVDLRLHRHPDDVGIHVSGRRGPIEVFAVK